MLSTVIANCLLLPICQRSRRCISQAFNKHATPSTLSLATYLVRLMSAILNLIIKFPIDFSKVCMFSPPGLKFVSNGLVSNSWTVTT